ncbi:VWA domain-containing protein [uncultured Hymenobacter sp.]|uniref:VWA domain-containing protein n=1 Tax=uncultured Hymenobacter sp. TaxID=170016 RepID=UPI0035CBA4F3
MTWAYPDFGLALGAALLALLLLALHWRRAWRLARVLGQGAGRLGWKLPLRLLAGAGLLLAWLGPALGVRQQPVRTTGQDVWLLVDVSRSMDAADVAPTRLLRAQAELQRLAAQFPADRLGLLVFGAEAFVQCPLTYDQAALQTFISTLSTRLAAPGPTSLREPLELLLHRLTPAAAALGESAALPPRATAVVLVSDGEDFGENLEPTVQALARAGARVYAVGVGTAAGGQLPGPNGRPLRDAKGQVVRSRLREAPLLQLAAQTSGRYLELNDRQNGFPTLLTLLRTAPAPTQQVRTVSVAHNRYRFPLAAALLLLALDVVLTITIIRP